MKLTSINIDGFGIYYDVLVNGLDSASLLIFHGQNEAGKSTLLGFLKTVFFGFPHANSRDSNYPPLAGGIHGGRIRVVTDKGSSYIVERKPGKKASGILTITSPDGINGGEELLGHVMGGITFDVFKNIYAFSLSELQTLDTLRSDSVKNVIYGATAGTSVLALPKAEKKINDHLDQLFKPRGSKQLINIKIAEYEEIRSKLYQARQGEAEFNHIYHRLKEVENTIQEFLLKLAHTSREKQKLKAYEQLWQEWVKIQESENALEKLPESIEFFPENGIQEFERNQNSLKTHQYSLTELENGIQQLRIDLASLTVNQSLINYTDSISYLLERKNRYVENCKDSLITKNKIEDDDVSILRTLENLGKDWTENDVLAIDRSVFTRESIRKFEDKLNSQNNELIAAEKILIDKKSSLQRSLQEFKLAEQVIEHIGEPEPEADAQIIQQLQNGRNEFASVVRDLEKYQNVLKDKASELARTIGNINPGWTESDIKNLDNSTAEKEKVAQFNSSINQAQQEVKDTKILFNSVEDTLITAKKKYEFAVEKLDETPKPFVACRDDLDGQRVSLQKLRKYLFENRELNQEILHLEERLSDKQQELSRVTQSDEKTPSSIFNLIIWGAVFLGILILLPLIALGKWIEVVFAGGILCVFAIVLLVLYRYNYRQKLRISKSKASVCDALQKQIKSIQEALHSNRKALAGLISESIRLGNEVGLTEPFTVDDLMTRENLMEKERHQLDQQVLLADAIQVQQAEIKKLEKDLENARKSVEESMITLTKKKDAWNEYLQRIKLNKDLTPSTVMDIFSKMDVVRQQLNGINALKEHISNMERIRDDYLFVANKAPALTETAQRSLHDFIAKVDKFISQFHDQCQHREEYHRARQIVEEKRKQRVLLEQEIQMAKGKYSDLVKTKNIIFSKWRGWLQDRGLPLDLSPKTALETLDFIAACVEKINQRNRLDKEVKTLEQDIAKYEKIFAELYGQLNRAVPNSDEIPIAVDRLVEELENSKGNLREKIQIERQIKKDKGRMESLQLQLNQSKQSILNLLEQGHSSNEEQFIKRGRAFLKKIRLNSEIHQAQKTIRRISGVSEFNRLRCTLEKLTIDEVQARKHEFSLKEKEIEHELEELRNQKADLNLRLSKMKSADDIARLRAEEERALEAIQELAFEWSRYAMARFLIEKAKKNFEKEQQPKVIQDAAVFFKRITHSRYHKLLAPIGTDTIEVVTSKNGRKKPEELSRGTLEQLYLSLRFGYIRNRAENSESLPVIMDDILVNFDSIRASNAAKTIIELSKDNQVFYFTCHRETVRMFTEIGCDLSIYDIENGQITKRK